MKGSLATSTNADPDASDLDKQEWRRSGLRMVKLGCGQESVYLEWSSAVQPSMLQTRDKTRGGQSQKLEPN